MRLADVLAALSVVTDLGSGQLPEKAIRACLIATRLGHHLGLSAALIADTYYTALLRHLGCTATAHEETYYFGGDELASRPLGERTDFGDRRETLELVVSTGRGSGLRRVRYLARTIRLGKRADAVIVGAVCEVAALLATRLGLGHGVREGVHQVFERWDGGGAPRGLAGEDVALPARLVVVAHQAVIFDRLGGPDVAVAMARRRAGGWFDPQVAEAFVRIGPDLLREVGSLDVWEAVLDAEPAPVRRIPMSGLDDVAHVFADMVDLKTPFTLGHSSGVAELAQGAATRLGLDESAVVSVRRAALLHDLGRVAVSNGVWEKPGRLTAADWEQVRLHPYYTERVLSRSEALRGLASLAGRHHERQDGGGYHSGVKGAEIPTGARLLAAADVLQALGQERPYRPAHTLDDAAKVLRSEAAAARLDVECVEAVLAAAGAGDRRVRAAWPADLSEREVEVLRLVAAGLSNREISHRLFVSPRTAEHHVQHIYDKIGIATRAGAALFAVEHDLLRR